MNKQEFYSQFKTHPAGAGFTAFIPTKSGKLNLSIVAGKFYYSSPREDMEKAEYHYAFEVAAFSGGNWATWDQIKDSGLFDIIGYGEHPVTKNEERSDINVWGWVGVEEIIEAINKC